MKALIIGYVWPETNASAAGLRDWSLIEIFQGAGWEVSFFSPAKENEFTSRVRAMGIRCESVGANDPRFDELVREIRPDAVIFDRFVIEEQFGWRVREHCPEAIRVVDTQDLHFLRRAREKRVTSLVTEDTLREIASIYRSDLTLVVSGHELGLLTGTFRVPEELLLLLGFCYREAPRPAPIEERRDFCMIGNFRHPPNADGVIWLKSEIWPRIRKALPGARVDVYGAYPSRGMMCLTDERAGFHVIGPASEQYETLSRYRVNLAPLRFGAGIKGKIADGWWVGTPAATTSIGAEGMRLGCEEGEPWGGLIAEEAEDLAAAAVELYADPVKWKAAQASGYRIMKELFDFDRNASSLVRRISEIRANLDECRSRNFIGQMLWHHLHRSTTYFSKWIELKERLGGQLIPGT